MAILRNFDPSAWALTYGGILLRGYADGTFISAERDEAVYTKKVGAQGDVTRIRSNNKAGVLTITLLAQSPSNDYLSGKLRVDERRVGGGGSESVLVKELNGTTIIQVDNGWIEMWPTVEVAADGSANREWAIGVADLDMFVGGTLV